MAATLRPSETKDLGEKERLSILTSPVGLSQFAELRNLNMPLLVKNVGIFISYSLMKAQKFWSFL